MFKSNKSCYNKPFYSYKNNNVEFCSEGSDLGYIMFFISGTGSYIFPRTRNCLICKGSGKFTWIEKVKGIINKKLPNGSIFLLKKGKFIKKNGFWYYESK